MQLLAWLAEQSVEHPEVFVDVSDFYGARSDRNDTAYGDLMYLEQRKFARNAIGMGGIESMATMLTPEGHDFLEELQGQLAHAAERRNACRDAMVAWLYSIDAIEGSPKQALREAMLEDAQHGTWLAVPFTSADLAHAAAWLKGQGLAAGFGADQDPGPLRLWLTISGISCAENYNSDTSRYFKERMGQGSGPTVNIGKNSGPVQVAGHHSHQVQHVGAGAAHLRDLIASVSELVRLAAPDTNDLDAQQAAALIAAKDEAVDQPAIKRFVNWVLSIVSTGTAKALTPAVTAATNELLHEAERLAIHL